MSNKTAKKRADKKTREKYRNLEKWKNAAGITHPKVKYPVMFGKGDNMYPGMMATEDIPPGEVMIRVPSNVIISTKAAYECQQSYLGPEKSNQTYPPNACTSLICTQHYLK